MNKRCIGNSGKNGNQYLEDDINITELRWRVMENKEEKKKIKLYYYLGIILFTVFIMLMIGYISRKVFTAKDQNLDAWIGKYKFSESIGGSDSNAPFMMMNYEIEIYQDEEEYFANITKEGQTTMVSAKAKLYGNEESEEIYFQKAN